jgi:hypothetical protein
MLLVRLWCHAEASSQRSSCRQPNALVWSLPRRSSAIACSRIQAMKRSIGMGVPCKPLPGQPLEQACPFPDLKTASRRVNQQGHCLALMFQPNIVGSFTHRDTAIGSDMVHIGSPMQVIDPAAGIDRGLQDWQMRQLGMSDARWRVVSQPSHDSCEHSLGDCVALQARRNNYAWMSGQSLFLPDYLK